MTTPARIVKVVLIEDDPMVQQVNRQFIENVPGFVVAGIAGNGTDGLRLIRSVKPELVILDIYMPSQDGRETLRQIRAEGLPVDVIVISAAKDAETIRDMVRGGAVDYLIKPFKFERVKQSLERYRDMRAKMSVADDFSQAELDRIWVGEPAASDNWAHHDDPALEELPKGLHAVTMRQVESYMRTRGEALSAEEVADGIGIARVTARRYLEYLEKKGRLILDIRYGNVGRPINRYAFRDMLGQ